MGDGDGAREGGGVVRPGEPNPCAARGRDVRLAQETPGGRGTPKRSVMDGLRRRGRGGEWRSGGVEWRAGR